MDLFDNLNLPEGGDTHDLEQLSRDKLTPILHSYLFIVRDENVRDYGVDMSIELRLANKAPTNIRFHAQLKAIDKKEIKAKRNYGYSIQINTANINYLLNSTKSIYILYVKSEDEFYFSWTDDVFTLLAKKDKDWSTKKFNPSIQFKQKLDEQALKHIYDEVRKNGKMLRQLKEMVNSPFPSSSSNIIINKNTLFISSDDEIISYLEVNGWNLINQGLSKEILEIANNATPKIHKRGKVCLILAFAHYNKSENYTALQLLRKALIDKNSLSDLDYQYLKFLELSIKKTYNHVTDTEFENELKDIRKKNDYIHYFLTLQELKMHFRSNPIEGYEKTTEILAQIIKKANKYNTVTLQAYSQLLFCKGWMNNHKFINNTAKINILEKISGIISKEIRNNNQKKLQEGWNEWQVINLEIAKRIEDASNPLLKAYYHYVQVQCIFREYILFQYINYRSEPEIRKGKNLEKIKGLLSILRKSSQIYINADHNSNLCSNLLLEYEILIYLDKQTEASLTLQQLKDIEIINDIPGLKNNISKIEQETYPESLKKSQDKTDSIIKEEEKAKAEYLENLEKEKKLTPNTKISKFPPNTLIIEIFQFGTFVIFPEDIISFCTLFNSKTPKKLKEVLNPFIQSNIIPIINPLYEYVSEEGILEGQLAAKKFGDNLRTLKKIIKLFDMGIYRFKTYENSI